MRARPILALLLAALLAALLFLGGRSIGGSPAPGTGDSVGRVLWEDRTLEVLVQGVLVLAGAFGVLALLRAPAPGREGGGA
ncbi:MAG: hypothetical protein HUU06_08100 [Planctomycetaceae bacterium]|nr:hypothetical protein [Planctomycetota bacterium]NUN52731.1 hypothetical protein [Planctomycetaceae bacterium]